MKLNEYVEKNGKQVDDWFLVPFQYNNISYDIIFNQQLELECINKLHIDKNDEYIEKILSEKESEIIYSAFLKSLTK